MSHHRLRPDDNQSSLLGDNSISKIASTMEKKAHDVWALSMEGGVPSVVRKAEETPPDPEDSGKHARSAGLNKSASISDEVVGRFASTICCGEEIHGQIIACQNGAITIDTPNGILDGVPLGFATVYPGPIVAYRSALIREAFGADTPALAIPTLNALGRSPSKREAQALGRQVKDWFAGRRFKNKSLDEVAQYLADPGLDTGPSAKFAPMIDKLIISELKGNAEARKALPAATRAELLKMVMRRDPIKKQELERIVQWGLHDTGKERGEGWLDRGKQQFGKWLQEKGKAIQDKGQSLGQSISDKGKGLATPPSVSAPATSAPVEAPKNPIAPEPLSEREKRIQEMEKGEFKGKTFNELHPGAKPPKPKPEPVVAKPPPAPPKPKAEPPPPPVEEPELAPEPEAVEPAPAPAPAPKSEPTKPPEPKVEPPKPPEPKPEAKPAPEPNPEPAPEPKAKEPAEPAIENIDPAVFKDLGLNPDDYKPQLAKPEAKPVSDKSTEEQVKEAIDQFEQEHGPFSGAKQRKFEQIVRAISNEVETNRKFNIDDAWKMLDESGLEKKSPETEKKPKVKKDPEVEVSNKEQTIGKQLSTLQKKLEKAEASDDVVGVAELHAEMASLRRQYKSLTGKQWTKGAQKQAAPSNWDPKQPLTPEEQKLIQERKSQPAAPADPSVKPPPQRPPQGMPPQQTDMVGGLFMQHKTDKLRFQDAEGNVLSVVEADPGHVAVFRYVPTTILQPMGEPQRMSNDEFNAYAFKNRLQGGDPWKKQQPGQPQQQPQAKTGAIENYENAVVKSYRLGARTRAART